MYRFMIPLAFVAACDDGTTTGTESDSGTPPTDCAPDGTFVGTTLIQNGNAACPVGDIAEITVHLTGLSNPGTAKVFIQETGNATTPYLNWSEEHDLDTILADQCGYEEDIGQTIEETSIDDFNDHVPNTNSVFDCTDHWNDPEVLTLVAYVEDADTPTTTDCFAWGHDGPGMVAGNYGSSTRGGVEPSFDVTACIAR